MPLRDLLPATRSKRTLPVRREEWSEPFVTIQREMNRMFDRFFGEATAPWDLPPSEHYFSPDVDIRETGKEILVEVELPGMDEKDMDVSVSGNVMTLRGEKRLEREAHENGLWHAERSYGKFFREILLPGGVDADTVEAKFRRGVLTVRLPRKADSPRNQRRIEIKAG